MKKMKNIMAITGILLSTLFLGGISWVISRMSDPQILDIMHNRVISTRSLSAEDTLVFAKTMSSWFGITVLVLYILMGLILIFQRYDKYPKVITILYVGMGLVTLFGSQLIAFPIAFLFFVAAFCSIKLNGAHHAH